MALPIFLECRCEVYFAPLLADFVMVFDVDKYRELDEAHPDSIGNATLKKQYRARSANHRRRSIYTPLTTTKSRGTCLYA